ncbi:hypothetical protein LTR84_012711 [Exophiala bonariae]|uniref:HMG box domain-containing protein n=1 Tax=Exophiala bonariae TaxID=1690606 RepID=A0AAV9NES6_9EURO|nr:hypothetical protein LTR84_012711 [Exophiala bonariae]
MDAVQGPFPPPGENQHRSAPLAPTQELAYRKKCIALKRRLAEIETNNDATRRKIIQETEHVEKMRLLRAILLNQLKDIMTTPAKKLTPEQRERLGLLANGRGNLAELAGPGITQELLRSRPEGDGLLDDSSEESDEEEPEPQERPERRRRANNNYRGETILNTNLPGDPSPAPYQQSSLPNLAPANSFSSATPIEPAALPRSSRLSTNTPQHGAQLGITDSMYAQSSPIPGNEHLGLHSPSQRAAHLDTNGLSRGPAVQTRPERPDAPFVQFTNHMRPQLEADDFAHHAIPARIQSEWDGLSPENRKLWDDRYQEQMQEYEANMDAWKKASRREASSSAFANS